MENFDMLIEKYKRDMLTFSKKCACIPQEEIFEECGTEKEEIYKEIAGNNDTDSDKNTVSSHEKNTDADEEHYGALKVMVFAGNEAFPVETANVEVFDKRGVLLYSRLTNSGGIADDMRLSAPDKSINDEPGGKDGFSLYTVRASHPDYDTEIFENVQIFEDIESIQPVYFQVKDGDGYNIISEIGEGE